MRHILFLATLLLVGCGAKQTKIVENETTGANIIKIKGEIVEFKISDFEYQKCEYVIIHAGPNIAIAHKGNCKHCQKHNK